jgi:SM-20-related protein
MTVSVMAGDGILILDDFLPAEIFDNVARYTASAPMLYGARSNYKTDPHGHWNRDFVTAGSHNLADVSSTLEGHAELVWLNAAWAFLRQTRLVDRILIRCYLNGYTYGTEGYFHQDSRRSDELTAILYLCDYWEPDWAGETSFLDERGDILKAVLPRRNRAVIFPAKLMHAGRSVSRKCVVLRQTLIFKARKRRSANFEKLSAFLHTAGASKLQHKQGSLHDHLVRSFALLEDKGCDESVCFGAGLHAIYGTNSFSHRIVSYVSKPQIVAAFGEHAEELAHLFSILDRPRTLEWPLRLATDLATVELIGGERLDLARKTFDDLRRMECANLHDQGLLLKHPRLHRLWDECGSGTAGLTL